jgi:hypothetical protein
MLDGLHTVSCFIHFGLVNLEMRPMWSYQSIPEEDAIDANIHRESLVQYVLRDDFHMRKVNFKLLPYPLDFRESRTDGDLSNVQTETNVRKLASSSDTHVGGADVTKPIREQHTVASKKWMCRIDFPGEGLVPE